MKTLRIVQLTIENVKRLVAVNLHPDGKSVIISGNNGAGKSSVLDSIMYAMGGTAAIPDKPIRNGQSDAFVVVDLGDFTVKRTWNTGGNTYLTVTAADGKPMRSPQAILDGLVGKLSFDPLEFQRMRPADQLATLRQVCGVDTTDIDRQRQEAYDERTVIGRQLKIAESQCAGLTTVTAPAEEVAIADLTTEYKQAAAINSNNANKRNDLARLVQQESSACDIVVELEKRLEAAKKERDRLTGLVNPMRESVAKLVDADVDSISKKIANAENVNRAVRQNQLFAEKKNALAAVQQKHVAIEKAIVAIDRQKQELLLSAKMPIDGLEIGESGIIFNKIPFAQCSSAEQLRVSVALGAALNPTLRVMLIRDGSLLDATSMAAITEYADTHDLQLWIERVGTDGIPSVVIEDGAVKEGGGQ